MQQGAFRLPPTSQPSNSFRGCLAISFKQIRVSWVWCLHQRKFQLIADTRASPLCSDMPTYKPPEPAGAALISSTFTRLGTDLSMFLIQLLDSTTSDAKARQRMSNCNCSWLHLQLVVGREATWGSTSMHCSSAPSVVPAVPVQCVGQPGVPKCLQGPSPDKDG